ncbi:hypothetical protein E4U53_003682, partial [Claviceps sorghi]
MKSLSLLLATTMVMSAAASITMIHDPLGKRLSLGKWCRDSNEGDGVCEKQGLRTSC